MNVHKGINAITKIRHLSLWLWGIASGVGIALFIHLVGYDAPLAAFLFAYFVMPVALAIWAGTALISLRKKWPWLKRISFNAGMLCGALVVQFLGTWAFSDLAADSPKRLKANCQRIQPALEAYRAANGRYPMSIGTLEQFKPLPDRFDPSLCTYYSSQDKYSFVVDGGFLSFWEYDSTLDQWRVPEIMDF